MRTAVIALAVLALSGCTDDATPQAGPPISRVAVVDLPQEPAHGPELPPQPAPMGEAKDAVGVAMNLVVHGLEEQGLVVIDIGAEPVEILPTSATVRIAVTHASDSGGLHTSAYGIDLIRNSHDRWISVGFRLLQ